MAGRGSAGEPGLSVRCVRGAGLRAGAGAVRHRSVALWSQWERYADGGARSTGDMRSAGAIWGWRWLVYAHYTGFIALAAHGVYLAWRTLRAPSRRRATLLCTAGLGLALGSALGGRWPGGSRRDRLRGRIAPGGAAGGAGLRLRAESPAGEPLSMRRRSPSWPSRAARRGSSASGAIARLHGAACQPADAHAAGRAGGNGRRAGQASGRHGGRWLGAALLIGLGWRRSRRRWLRWPKWIAAGLVWLPARADLRPVYDSHRARRLPINQNAQDGDVLVLRDGTLFTAAGITARRCRDRAAARQATDVERTLFFDEANRSAGSGRAKTRRAWVGHGRGTSWIRLDRWRAFLRRSASADWPPVRSVYVSLYDPTTRRAPNRRVGRCAPASRRRPMARSTWAGTWWNGSDAARDRSRAHVVAARRHGHAGHARQRAAIRRGRTFYSQLDSRRWRRFGQEHWQPGSRSSAASRCGAR